MHRRHFVISLCIALAATFSAEPAFATNVRSYVATFGNDEAACTFDAPCRSLTYALTQTSSVGEIIILDSGDYDPISLSQSVSIIANDGVFAGIVATSGNAITINGSGIHVILRGIAVRHTGTGYGVYYQTGASLHIEKSVFHVTGGRSISMEGAGEMFVSDTVFHNSGNPAVIHASAHATFVRVLSLNSIGFGFNFEGGTIVVRDCVISGAYTYGIVATSIYGGSVKLTVDRTTIRGNGGTGVAVSGSNAHVVVTRSTITENGDDGIDSTGSAVVVLSDSVVSANSAYAFYFAGGGVIKSTGDNTVEGNSAGTTLGGSLTLLAKQ